VPVDVCSTGSADDAATIARALAPARGACRWPARARGAEGEKIAVLVVATADKDADLATT
jgi:hypothetical protein